jgi:transcriptional regulator of nitric oxide reductase
MLSTNNNQAKLQESRALFILKGLWKKFWQQKPLHRAVTFMVMLLTILWMFIFYSSFIIWQVFSFVMTKVLLFSLEWYLKKG